jgi:hypothetical protein
MVIISLDRVLKAVYNGSPAEIALKLGLVTSLSYHFLFQFPRQAAVSKCLFAFVACNIISFLLTITTGPETTILSCCKGMLAFNITFVSSHCVSY